MISFPQSGVVSTLSYNAQQRESASLSVVAKQAENQNAVKVSASYASSSSVTITGKVEQSATFAPEGVAKYEAIADGQQKPQAANNILKFISLRLQQDVVDGASSEEIASRLQAGLDGFIQGYNEAFEQLSGAGLLTPEAEKAVEQTYDAVLKGIDELAEKYGVISPVTPDPTAEPSETESPTVSEVPVQVLTRPVSAATPQQAFAEFAQDFLSPEENLAEILEASTISAERLASRDFSFSVKTQDGDRVIINASSFLGERVSAESVDYSGSYGEYSAGRFAAETSSSNQFSIRVKGELDEDEMNAINDLLSQVGDLTETFFDGDIEEAFQMALNIGFDSSEIAKFSLNLKQEVVTRVETTYASVGGAPNLLQSDVNDKVNFANGDNSINRLIGFIKMLQEATQQADSLGIDRSVVPDFAKYVANEQFGEDPRIGKIQPFFENIVDQIPQDV